MSERAIQSGDENPPSGEGLASPLSSMQEAFAVNYATNGGNGKQAAIDAGYSQKSAAVLAHRMIRNPLIAKRIAEECHLVMAMNVPMALGTQRGLLAGERVSPMVKHLVAQDMLNRVLGTPTQRVHAQVDGELKVSIDLG